MLYLLGHQHLSAWGSLIIEEMNEFSYLRQQLVT